MLFVAIKQFAVETGLGAFYEHVPSENWVLGIYLDLEFFQFLQRKSQSLLIPSDNNHRMHALLNVIFRFLQQLAREKRNRSGSIPYLIILKSLKIT